MKKFIGFYWTLPVPWAGFRELPKDPDAAAAGSKTIRYQRDRVRSWVKSEKGALVHEEVFVDMQPDRGTEFILPVIDQLLHTCDAEDAALVLVDFSEAFGWRRHGPLWDRLSDERQCIPLDPSPVVIDGAAFDPVGHFRAWREIEYAHIGAKADREKAAQDAINALQGENVSVRKMADELNESGVMTPTGKRWSEDNLRKFLKSR